MEKGLILFQSKWNPPWDKDIIYTVYLAQYIAFCDKFHIYLKKNGKQANKKTQK